MLECNLGMNEVHVLPACTKKGNALDRWGSRSRMRAQYQAFSSFQETEAEDPWRVRLVRCVHDGYGVTRRNDLTLGIVESCHKARCPYLTGRGVFP